MALPDPQEWIIPGMEASRNNREDRQLFNCSTVQPEHFFPMGNPYFFAEKYRDPYLVGGWTTHLKNISQIGNLPQVGVKIKNVWNHHLVIFHALFVGL